LRVAIVVEAIPPYCGGGEQVAWIHAVEMVKRHEVTVVTFGEKYGKEVRDGVEVFFLPRSNRALFEYSTIRRSLLNDCIDRISPDVIHCHMPNVLSACIRKKKRLLVNTIHDSYLHHPGNRETISRQAWFKYTVMRRINVVRSDIVTCVSRYSRDIMRSRYRNHANKIVFIPNPISERFFTPVENADDGYVLNFGRQIEEKMGSLIKVARRMPETKFLFVGTGNMAKDHGLPNAEFVGFSNSVEKYMDKATICVFPSLSENFPLAGLEAMARGKPVIATRSGFSEYIEHDKNGILLESADFKIVEKAIKRLQEDRLFRKAIGQQGRITAEQYQPGQVLAQYERLYQDALRDDRINEAVYKQ